jgi:hypothetical protein
MWEIREVMLIELLNIATADTENVHGRSRGYAAEGGGRESAE